MSLTDETCRCCMLPPDEPLIDPPAPEAVLPVLLPPVLPAVLPAEPVDEPLAEPPLPDVELPPIELPEAPELSRRPWTCTL